MYVFCFLLCYSKTPVTSPALFLSFFFFFFFYSRGLGQFPGHFGSNLQDALQVWTKSASSAHVRSVGELALWWAEVNQWKTKTTYSVTVQRSCGYLSAKSKVLKWLQDLRIHLDSLRSLFPMLVLITSCINILFLYLLIIMWHVISGLTSVFVSAVEHTSETRKTYRADVWALQHSCLLPLQVSCSVRVSFPTSCQPGKNTVWSWLNVCLYVELYHISFTLSS